MQKTHSNTGLAHDDFLEDPYKNQRYGQGQWIVNKAVLRKVFDRLFATLPRFLHTGILKSYANQPRLSLLSGFRCFPQVFYSPLVDPREIDLTQLGQKRDLPGVRIDMMKVSKWLMEISQYAPEFSWAPRDRVTGKVPWADTYTTLDSMVLYCLLRHLKPRRYIEVGCGVSSMVSSEALRANEREGCKAEAVFIEPYPGPRLEGIHLYGSLLIQKIQEVSLSKFKDLRENDVLFIDTSHVLKCQNDVEYELLRILPSLSHGVMIHLHDIYTPFEQPEDWLLGRYAPGGSNEQYAVEALLSGGDKFEVCLPLHLMGRECPGMVASLLGRPVDRGQAFWIRKS